MNSLSQTPLKRQKILIVDDNATNVELLCAQLKPYNYELFIAYDGDAALKKIEENPPDLVLLDLMMPKVSGYEVCQQIKKNKKTQLIPVIIVTALKDLNDKIKAIEIGADDFLLKPFNKLELITRIKSLLKLKELYDDVEMSEDIIFALAEMLEAKDIYTRGHSERVARYSVALAKFVGLSDPEQELIRRGALLHDIGKIGVREQVLNKPDKLSQEELAHIRSHPARGCELCKTLKSLQSSLSIIRHHHERADGRGYPDAIQLNEITTGARIVSIVDSYDAMTSNRPYRKGIPPTEAIKIFEKEKDFGQWDPLLADQWIKLLKKSINV